MVRLQKKTDILVIDQVNNNGGYVFYFYGLLGSLSDKPLKLPKHRIMMTHENIMLAWAMILELEDIDTDDMARDHFGDTLLGYPVTKKLVD
jgi:hypothetical protein